MISLSSDHPSYVHIINYNGHKPRIFICTNGYICVSGFCYHAAFGHTPVDAYNNFRKKNN